MSAITTHVLDTAEGRPAAGVPVTLEYAVAGSWREVGHGETDADGRCRTLLKNPLAAGGYRITFEVHGHFYPRVVVYFNVDDATQHYHIPLLLSPYGYSTYRGS
jgi:5-hydroxyisourate hydrolase